MSVYIKDSSAPAVACLIWMHGLGADANDMVALADQLILKGIAVRHVFMDAPMRSVTLNGGMVMRAWYDIVGMDWHARADEVGIKHSEQLIREVIDAQVKEGFSLSQMYLVGFSQGGAMALHTSLHLSVLGGVIALSAYLPLNKSIQVVLDKQTPFFIAAGQYDSLVKPEWTRASRDWLLANQYQQVAFHQYPMDHAICMEEIKDLSIWLAQHVQGVAQ